MTNKEKREALAAKVLSREGKNQYTQDDNKRLQVGSGYSDCSSLQWWAHKEVLGIDIGGYTGAQVTSGKLANVSMNISGGLPEESKMLPGDLLFFRGNNNYTYSVGHVEMYIGNTVLIGHNSGTGPTKKNMYDYCRTRQATSYPAPAGNKGLICVRRAIPRDGSDEQINTKGDWDNMDKEKFVEDLYVLILGRLPDSGGKQAWLNKINAGTSFIDVYGQFCASDEALTRYVQELFRFLLFRDPDAEGLKFFVNQLKNGMSRIQLMKNIMDTAEYKSKH